MFSLEGTTVSILDDKSFDVLHRGLIDFNEIEIINDGEGNTVAYEIDVRGSMVSVFSFEGSGTFDSGRNSYVLEFDGLGKPGGPSLYSVEFIPALNTIRIPDSNLTFSDNRIDVSVSDLDFHEGAGFAVQLGFAISGSGRADLLFGDTGKDRVAGKGGNDVIHGGYGEDILFGDAGNDQINGGGQSDQIRGGLGKDTINGGSGNDRIFGGAGADTFVIDARNGKDDIRDFDVEVDRLLVRTGASSLDDMSVTFGRGFVTLKDEGTSVVLNGLTISQLGDIEISFV